MEPRARPQVRRTWRVYPRLYYLMTSQRFLHRFSCLIRHLMLLSSLVCEMADCFYCTVNGYYGQTNKEKTTMTMKPETETEARSQKHTCHERQQNENLRNCNFKWPYLFSLFVATLPPPTIPPFGCYLSCFTSINCTYNTWSPCSRNHHRGDFPDSWFIWTSVDCRCPLWPARYDHHVLDEITLAEDASSRRSNQKQFLPVIQASHSLSTHTHTHTHTYTCT